MKALVVYVSVHHGNTEKIARVLAKVLRAELLRLDEVDAETAITHDVVGFGSGIYFSRIHKSLLRFVSELPKVNRGKAFIFSTGGFGLGCHRPLRRKLSEKGFEVIGEFACKGFCDYGPFKLVGGINRGRPNEEDMQKAETFAREILLKTKQI